MSINIEVFLEFFQEFSTYYNKDLSKNSLAIEAWFQACNELCNEPEELKALFVQAINNFHWMPSPLEFTGLIKNNKIQPLDEWIQLVSSLKNNQFINLSEPSEKAITSLGGRKYLSQLSTEELYKYIEAKFLERWHIYQLALDNGQIKPTIYLSESQSQPEPEPEMSPEKKAELFKNIKAFLNNLDQ
jgi:hypothetical protein